MNRANDVASDISAPSPSCPWMSERSETVHDAAIRIRTTHLDDADAIALQNPFVAASGSMRSDPANAAAQVIGKIRTHPHRRHN